MKTMTRGTAAYKMQRTVEELGDYDYVRVRGNAWTPERFWGHDAMSREEYEELKDGDGMFFRLIDSAASAAGDHEVVEEMQSIANDHSDDRRTEIMDD